jgi:hypothetical protein
MTSHAICSHAVDRAVRRRTGGRAGPGCPCRFRSPGEAGPDAVIEQVGSGDPMTVDELRRAAALLGRHVGSGRTDVLVARVRVAVRLEQLGA